MRHILGRSQGRIGLMKRFPTLQEHPLSSAASGLLPPLPTSLLATTHRKSGRLPGTRPALGACPAGQSPPGCASPACRKAASEPRPGAPCLGGTFAILKPESADWYPASERSLDALFVSCSRPPGSRGLFGPAIISVGLGSI
jgi:hypothetical protein